MQRLVTASLVLVFVAAAAQASAADKPDPTGTWKWTMAFGQNRGNREVTLKLKLDAGKLTGALLGRDNKENPIQDGTYKDGDLAFKVVRERNGNKMTQKFTGKLSGDTIKGKIEFDRNGQTQSRDWEAKRAKD
jgi:hypothetical protein